MVNLSKKSSEHNSASNNDSFNSGVLNIISTSWTNHNSSPGIRVYVSQSGFVIEKCTDGGDWYVGAFRAQGRAVAVTSWHSDNIYIRLYVEHEDYLHENCWDGNGWYQGEFRVPAMNATAESWRDYQGVHIRVFGFDHSGEGLEYCYEDNRGWVSKRF